VDDPGRIIVTLISAAKENVIAALFRKVTDPVYNVVRAIVPFAVVPPEKQGTMWGAIGGCIPFFSFFLSCPSDHLDPVLYTAALVK